MAGLGAITPVGWVAIGAVVVAGVVYSKAKSRHKSKNKTKTKVEKKKEPRSKEPIAKRKIYNTRKKAKEAAKRAGKGKIKNDYKGKKGSHFHPEVKSRYRKTPKGVCYHDHYFYPGR